MTPATAGHVLALLVDEKCWAAAADVAQWQIAHSRTTSKLRVLKFSMEHRARAEVVLALTLGLVQRARLLPGRRADAREGDYICVHDDVTYLESSDPALLAALAIWLMENPARS